MTFSNLKKYLNILEAYLYIHFCSDICVNHFHSLIISPPPLIIFLSNSLPFFPSFPAITTGISSLGIITCYRTSVKQTDMHRHNSSLTHPAGTRLHCTPTTIAPNPCMQSLTPSYALQLWSFPRLTAA